MRIEKLLKTLKREFYKINFLQAALDSSILFLLLGIVYFFLDVTLHPNYWDYHLLGGIAVLFLFINFLYRSKDYTIEIYEEENPELNELLRTAKDNVKKSNTASEALFDEIKDLSRNVSSESIIPNNQILAKTLIIGVLSIATVMTGTIGDDFTTETLENVLGTEDEEETAPTGEFDYELQDGEDALGNHSDIDPEDMDIEYDTNPQEDVRQTAPFASRQEVESLQQFEDDTDMDLAQEYLELIREEN